MHKELIEEIQQGPVRQHHDLVPNGAVELAAVVNIAGRFPGRAAIGRAGEPDRLPEGPRMDQTLDAGQRRAGWRGETVPRRVRVVGVGGVGRDGLLVIKGVGNVPVAGVPDQANGLTPGIATVGRLADEDTVSCGVGVEGETDLISRPGGAEGYPRIRGAFIIAAVRGVSTGALTEVREGPGPGCATVVRDAGHQAMRSAVRPPVLLPDRDHVVRIGRVDVQPVLFLLADAEKLARNGWDAGAERAGGERTCARYPSKGSHGQRTGSSHLHRGEAENER